LHQQLVARDGRTIICDQNRIKKFGVAGWVSVNQVLAT